MQKSAPPRPALEFTLHAGDCLALGADGTLAVGRAAPALGGVEPRPPVALPARGLDIVRAAVVLDSVSATTGDSVCSGLPSAGWEEALLE